ncbi:hypothetical protein [Dipodfec virus UOA04_Rod_962]|nr:hypothetical protein [Dipodfec virus UOA04_Rod_962]
MHALTPEIDMAHHRHRNRHRKHTITFPDNRNPRRLLDEHVRLGYRRAEPTRIDRLPDTLRRQAIRNLPPRPQVHQPTLRRIDDPGRRLDLHQAQSRPIRQPDIVDLPREHPICQRRQERKEVLFAKRKAGKGGQKPMKLPRLLVRCK